MKEGADEALEHDLHSVTSFSPLCVGASQSEETAATDQADVFFTPVEGGDGIDYPDRISNLIFTPACRGRSKQ